MIDFNKTSPPQPKNISHISITPKERTPTIKKISSKNKEYLKLIGLLK